MDEAVFNRLKEFVIDESGVDDQEIDRATKIYDDLGIYGDDANDFLIANGKIFNVDLSNFMASDYFNSEGDVILPAIIRAITGKKKQVKKILTVGHLEKGIVAGKLDEEVIGS